MEGTSGAAERVSLRGDVREAALNAGSRVSGAPRGEPVDVALLKRGLIRRWWRLQPPTETGLRQEVSEPIRLGKSSVCERSQRGEADRGLTTLAPTL